MNRRLFIKSLLFFLSSLSFKLLASNKKVNISFDHGVASGDPTNDQVILWTKISTEEHVEKAFVDENKDLMWMNGRHKGYVSMNITEEFIDVSFKFISTVKSQQYDLLESYQFRVEHNKPYSA